MTKSEKARKLINEQWRDVMKIAVEKEFGDIEFKTEYNFLTDKIVSTWIKGLGPTEFEEGCLACQKLMTTL